MLAVSLSQRKSSICDVKKHEYIYYIIFHTYILLAHGRAGYYCEGDCGEIDFGFHWKRGAAWSSSSVQMNAQALVTSELFLLLRMAAPMGN